MYLLIKNIESKIPLFTKIRKVAALFKYNAENKRNLIDQIKISNLAEPHTLSLGESKYYRLHHFYCFINYILIFF